MRKMICLPAILLAVILLIAGCAQKKTEEKKKIKIGICIWPGYAHAFIAKEKGLFRKNHVDVELVLTKNYADILELYRNGKVDGLFGVYADLFILNSEGISTQVVYVVDYSDTGDVIIGKPKFSSLAELKKGKVSCEGLNTFSHIFVLKALEKSGLKESDIQFEIIPAMDVLTALEKGQIDAGHTWEPVTSQALKKGYKILGKAGDVPGLITDVLAFRAQVIKERPDDIQRIVKALFEARDFVYSKRDEALEMMTRAEGMSREEMEKGIDGIRQPDLKGNIKAMQKSKETTSLYRSGEIITDFYLNRGQLSQVPNLDEIIVPKFVIQLGKEASSNQLSAK